MSLRSPGKLLVLAVLSHAALHGAARAEEETRAPAAPLALIDRPITLPAGAFEPVLLGVLTNWGNGSFGGGSRSVSGESLAIGLDVGASGGLQLGFAAALAINPGAGFGTVVANGTFALGATSAARVDLVFERFGANGDNTASSDHATRFGVGFGLPARIPLGPTLAFVSGRTSAVRYGQYANVGDNGTGLYYGATTLTECGADLISISGGNNDSGTAVGINLPLGLLVQPDPRFALTLRAGYSAVIVIPSGGGNTVTDHFVPLGLEAVVSPSPQLDVGASFSFDGYLGQSGSSSSGGPGYFDLRALQVWIRFRAQP